MLYGGTFSRPDIKKPTVVHFQSIDQTAAFLQHDIQYPRVQQLEVPVKPPAPGVHHPATGLRPRGRGAPIVPLRLQTQGGASGVIPRGVEDDGIGAHAEVCVVTICQCVHVLSVFAGVEITGLNGHFFYERALTEHSDTRTHIRTCTH
jgi:hypothetical protein